MSTPPVFITCLAVLAVALLALGIAGVHAHHWFEGVYGLVTGAWALFLVIKWYRS